MTDSTATDRFKQARPESRNDTDFQGIAILLKLLCRDSFQKKRKFSPGLVHDPGQRDMSLLPAWSF